MKAIKFKIIRNLFLIGIVLLANFSFAQFKSPTPPKSKNPEKEFLYFGQSRNQSVEAAVPPEGFNIPTNNSKSPLTCLYTTNAQLAALTAAQLVSYLKSTHQI